MKEIYKRKTKEADIRLRIDYNEFIHASEEERLNIYNNHIVQSIRTLQKKLGPDFNYPRLEEDIKTGNINDKMAVELIIIKYSAEKKKVV